MSVKDKLRAARRPEKVERVCLRADLVEAYEQALAAVDAAAAETSRSLAGAGEDVAAAEARVDELRDQVAEASIEIRLRALPRPAFRTLVAQHPPRTGDDGEVLAADVHLGINRETFPDALIRACAVDSGLDEEDWAVLLGEAITDAQYDRLFLTSFNLNKQVVDVPF